MSNVERAATSDDFIVVANSLDAENTPGRVIHYDAGFMFGKSSIYDPDRIELDPNAPDEDLSVGRLLYKEHRKLGLSDAGFSNRSAEDRSQALTRMATFVVEVRNSSDSRK